MPNETTTFAQVTTSQPSKEPAHNGERTIEVGLWKLLSAGALAIFLSIISTAFVVGGVLNADHFTLVTAIEDIKDLKENSVDKEVLVETLTPIRDTTIRIEGKIDALIQRELDQASRQSSVPQPSRLSSTPTSSPTPQSANPVQASQPVNQSVVVEAPKEEPAPGPQPESNPTISTPIVEIDLPLGGLLRGS